MESHRFYAPDAREPGQRVQLLGDEAVHARRTLRLGPGARVRVFDGRGLEFRAEIAATDRHQVTVDLRERLAAVPEPRIALTVAAALLKGRTFDAVVRDATMLGVAAIQPLVTTHTDVPKIAAHSAAQETRWHRLTVAAAKQSGRAVLPTLRPVVSFETYLAARGDDPHVVLVEPQRVASITPSRRWRAGESPPLRASLSIGPEGGWTEDEIEAATAQGAELLTLGTATLRADAVPIVAIAVLRFAWGDL